MNDLMTIFSTASGDLWAFAVLEQILGAGPHIKWASNTTSNRLNTALATKTQDPYHVSILSICVHTATFYWKYTQHIILKFVGTSCANCQGNNDN